MRLQQAQDSWRRTVRREYRHFYRALLQKRPVIFEAPTTCSHPICIHVAAAGARQLMTDSKTGKVHTLRTHTQLSRWGNATHSKDTRIMRECNTLKRLKRHSNHEGMQETGVIDSTEKALPWNPETQIMRECNTPKRHSNHEGMQQTGMIDSTENALHLKSTQSRNSNFSSQIQIKTKSEFEFVPRDTVKSEFLNLVGLENMVFSVETVIRRNARHWQVNLAYEIRNEIRCWHSAMTHSQHILGSFQQSY